MRTIHEREPLTVSCLDHIVFLFRRILNMHSSSVWFYNVMDSHAMRQILDDMRVGAGVFDSP